MILNYDWKYDPKAPQYHTQYEAKTDQEGNFVFERAVPKETRASRQLHLNKEGRYSGYVYSHPEKIVVKPGETVSVQVGGKGRPVIGRVVVPNDPISRAWNLSGWLQTKMTRPILPEGYDEWPEEQVREWRKKYQESPERKALEDARKSYGFAIGDDGSFRVEDAAPGVYQVQMTARDPNGENKPPVAMAQADVTIEEIPGGQSDEPLDVGVVELKPNYRLTNGSELPVTIFKTPDGPAVNLVDYRGKFLLIHFWSSRYKQFAPELSVLKEIYEAYGRNGRLVMIGINTNSIPATGKAFAEQNGMKWVQAYVGINSNLYQDLRIQAHPAHLLIGPDGKLINNVTKIEDLKGEVARAVGKGPK